MLEEWNYETMKDICTVNQGFQINISQREKHKRNNNKIYITIQHLKKIGNDEFIRDIDHNDSVVCDKNDVLMTRTGNTGCVVTNVQGVFHNNFFKINFDRNRIDKDYLVYYLNKKSIQTLILSKAGTSTIPDLNHNDFYSIPFVYPKSIKEQKAIANVLANMDKLVECLERTIEKKEKIFEELIQELLSGKNRIYEWKKIRVGDIGNFEGNGVDKKIKEGEKRIRLLNYMDIMNNNFIYSEVSNFFVTASNEKINKCSVKKGDIFLTPSSETRLDIGVSAVAMEDIKDLVYSYHIVRFRPSIEMDLLFRAYIFKNKNFLMQASTMCEGSGKRYVCSNKKFASFEIEIPLDVREQKDIANKLNTMEEEINVLKKKLHKYKKIKEGMMEDLLTGKVRLNYE